MSFKFGIYGLIDPITNQLKYIGLTTRGFNRIREHSMPSVLRQTRNLHKKVWLSSLLEIKVQPEVIIIESFDNDLNFLSLNYEIQKQILGRTEEFWIAYFKSIGCNLVNATLGGETPKGFKWSDEDKRRMSIQRKGRKLTEQHKINISLGHKNNKKPRKYRGPLSDKQKHKMSIALKGHKAYTWTQEQRKAQSLRKIGKKQSIEHIQKRADANRGNKQTPRSEATRLKAALKRGIKSIIDQYGNIYPSAMIASEKLNLHHSLILKVLYGTRKHTGGYIFKYID